jgi:hypothetical protein
MTPPGKTTTGAVLERMVPEALAEGGYSWEKPKAPIGIRPGGGRHYVDLVVSKGPGPKILVSLKWQQASGTAEQKVPFEVICLAEALKSSDGLFDRAYLVLGGPGWTLREFFTKGGLEPHLRGCEGVTLLDMETFIARANASLL